MQRKIFGRTIVFKDQIKLCLKKKFMTRGMKQRTLKKKISFRIHIELPELIGEVAKIAKITNIFLKYNQDRPQMLLLVCSTRVGAVIRVMNSALARATSSRTASVK